jgi:hypothetical protein
MSCSNAGRFKVEIAVRLDFSRLLADHTGSVGRGVASFLRFYIYVHI